MPEEATTVDIRPAEIPAPGQGGAAPAPVHPAERPATAPAEASAGPEHRPHIRLVHGLRRPANWLQLVRFGVVGGVGFAVNLAVYAVCVRAIGIDYHVAAVAAWMVAVMNNFLLNRHWTFDAGGGRAGFQAVRFVAVSLVAFGFSLVLLTLLVESAGVAKVPAQALAVAASTPLNFLGNKLWSFRKESGRIPAGGL